MKLLWRPSRRIWRQSTRAIMRRSWARLARLPKPSKLLQTPGPGRMETIFDIVTVGCLVAIALAYFRFAANNLRALLNLLISGVAFAVANQAGNAGYFLIATLLIL